ncbi:uncharacterized protein N7496_000238 [Penicillium cataractarum]|uniref:Uncharacterized protein n=1 Tax=Penicillium cataractarum TaxID=2100454 RepID=A0A9W9VU11_9EURO|nr:uncharacterized protein N7496_000238 [Penicillium cataractarum]KAJ5389170.1 hypothetical protein N7496_000238 [Penicillium cataractarum]
MAGSEVPLILLGWPLEPTQHIAAAKDCATYAKSVLMMPPRTQTILSGSPNNAINSADIERAGSPTKMYPLRDSLDIHRYPSPVSLPPHLAPILPAQRQGV